MLSNKAVVVRDGEIATLLGEATFTGDMVMLRPGDCIPADLCLFEVHNLCVEEAILTEESTVVSKKSDALKGEKSLGDQTQSGLFRYYREFGYRVRRGHGHRRRHRAGAYQRHDEPYGRPLCIRLSAARHSAGFAGAVATVPEGLSAIISIILSLGGSR